jgi:PAS domain S-box-containing protein
MDEHTQATGEIIASLERRLSALEAENAHLAVENTLLRQLYERAPLSYQSLDENGCFLSVNKAWLDVLGYRQEEVIGRNFADFLHPDWQEHFRKNFPRFKAVGEILGVEFEMRKKDGSFIFVSFNGKIGKDSRGRFQQTYCIFQDITQQKIAEEALIESEKKWCNIIVSTPQIGISLDPQGKIVFANVHFLQLVGWNEEEVLGQDWFDMFLPSHVREDMRTVFSTVMNKKDTLTFSSYENEIVTRKGELRNVAWSNVLSKDVHGNILDVTCLGLDLTESKNAEAERQKLQEQLLQAQKMESIGRLAGGVAHDFNNMLGVILGRAEMAQEYCDSSSPIYDDLQEIRKAGERSVNLTRQLLAFARKQTIAPKVLNLNEAVTNILTMVQRLIGEDIDLVWRPGAGLWLVKMDPSQLDQILANLCINARDAIAGVGKLTIETENTTFDAAYCATHRDYIPGDYVLLALSDNGCGMDKETLDHLFEPFFTTKEMGKGTGLGLATVYGIVKQNNGFINVYSEPGHGTTFKIYLSRHRAEAESVLEGGATLSEEGGSETILLVEDEAAILAMTTAMLVRLGYNVLPANTPGEAIRLAESFNEKISLLLTDVVMPEMNGRDLARQMISLYPELKTLFMSGYTANVIAHHGVLDEGVEFIEKPFSKNDLAARIRALMERVSPAI